MTSRYSAIVCSFIRPFSPGHSGGEIRDYHLLRRLATIANVKFISMTDAQPNGRLDAFESLLAEYYEPKKLLSRTPQWVNKRALRRSWLTRLVGLLRLVNFPVFGLKYHRDISLVSWQTDAYVLPILARQIEIESPDFIFVTPQLNPALLRLGLPIPSQTRTILLTYDVEAVRLDRLADAATGLARVAKRLEAQRAERFERENLRLFDGVVVVSDLDKATMIERYQLDPERVLVIENSVDVEYFSFTGRAADTPGQNIVFVGNLAYWPNHDAAVRLLRDIMPRIRASYPAAKAWIVGDRPSAELERLAHSSGMGVVTGPVEDVRPFLGKASIVCIPLRAGSGTKYKVLEALSVGRPVVCTSIATEGLDIQPGTHFLLADGDDEIADACIRILQQPEAVQGMAGEARERIVQRYSWERNLEKLDSWLAKIKQMPAIKH